MKISKNIILTILIVLVSFLIYFYLPKESTFSVEQKQDITKEILEKNIDNNPIIEKKVSLGELNFTYEKNYESSVYEYMLDLRKNKKIEFIEKNYIGMGKFIEEINGVKNGNKSWIYYINEKKAEIGISQYKLKNGDKLMWKYENLQN